MMRILRIVVLIVMFAGITASTSTLERLDSLRVMALEKEGMEDTTAQMTKVNANRAVNVAIQWVSANFQRLRKRGLTPVPMVFHLTL